MKLPGTTIIETIAAALLVVVSFGIGTMIYLNVLTSEQTVAKVKARVLLCHVLEKTKTEQRYFSESMEIDGIWIEKIVMPYSTEHPDAVLLVVTAFQTDKTKEICSLKEIYYPINTQ